MKVFQGFGTIRLRTGRTIDFMLVSTGDLTGLTEDEAQAMSRLLVCLGDFAPPGCVSAAYLNDQYKLKARLARQKIARARRAKAEREEPARAASEKAAKSKSKARAK